LIEVLVLFEHLQLQSEYSFIELYHEWWFSGETQFPAIKFQWH